MTLTAILTQDPDGGYVALNPETGTTTQGETVEEALAQKFPISFRHVVFSVVARASRLRRESDSAWMRKRDARATENGEVLALANLKEATELYLEEFPLPQALRG